MDFFENDFKGLLPEDILISDKEEQEIQKIKQYSENSSLVKSFDEILDRPFIEVLLLALYFANHPILENSIVDLI